jgi:hypothetical protein
MSTEDKIANPFSDQADREDRSRTGRHQGLDRPAHRRQVPRDAGHRVEVVVGGDSPLASDKKSRLGGLDRFVGALAIHHGGVEFEAIDGRPVSILFAVIGPERAAGEHLKCLARIGRLLRDDGVRARLQGAKSAEDALSIVREVDG